MTIEVIVGNIGTVFSEENATPADEERALRVFDNYVELSKQNVGRAAGESVTMFKDGEIYCDLISRQES